jgi:hypothetical protein
MKISRLVELTLFYRIRSLFLVQKVKEITKNASADLKTYIVKYNNMDTSHSVSVYVNDLLVNTGFILDYENGIVFFNTALTRTDVVKIDYWYCSVNIYDEGKDPRDDKFHYPAIAIYEDIGTAEGIELGTANRERTMTWILEVWTERGGERSDLIDSLVEFFEESEIPIIDFNVGFPTNRDGTKNISFNPNEVVTYALSDSINYSKDGSLDIGKTPKYVGKILVNLRVIP